MKMYLGTRAPEVRVQVVTDGSCRALRTRDARHSPTGLEWGYAGSGPAELARQLLWDLTGEEPVPALYQAFKARFVEHFPRGAWIMSEDMIRAWLADVATDRLPDADAQGFAKDHGRTPAPPAADAPVEELSSNVTSGALVGDPLDLVRDLVAAADGGRLPNPLGSALLGLVFRARKISDTYKAPR